ncbi:hypothetical protein ACOSQ2_029799 [Xanthoceras sorbifolium]
MVSIVSSSMGLCSLVFGPMFSFVSLSLRVPPRAVNIFARSDVKIVASDLASKLKESPVEARQVHKTSSVFSARVLLLVRFENSSWRIHHSEKHLMQVNLRSMKFVGCWLAITGFPWKQYIPVSEDGASFTFSSNSAHSPPQTTRN